MEPDSLKFTLGRKQLKSRDITATAREMRLPGNKSKVKPQIQSQKKTQQKQFKCNTGGNLEAGTGKHRRDKLEDNSKLLKTEEH